ncbi:MAG TPA: valine--tRNA ligase [Bacteroidetes bacterium]|nr:valine--tRNA ligase [Bacteroidota bacterium]
MDDKLKKFKVIDPQSLPKHFEATNPEEKWRQAWEENGTYHYDPSISREKTFVVDTPPPTVSGSLHIGHIFSYSHTDFIARYKRMTGKNIFYPMGWDDNGLPTERRVQNYFHVRCDPQTPYEEGLEREVATAKIRKKRPLLVSRKNFIELCNQLTQEDEKVFKELWQRLGLSVDWRQEYATIDNHSRKIAQLSFLDLFGKDKIYASTLPISWDVDFQTSVAQAEVEDRDDRGQLLKVKFMVKDSDETFTIATTRPELLPACVGVTCNAEDPRYAHLIGKMAITPLFGVEVPIFASPEADPEKGTGIVMVCTFGDTTDVDWWRREKLNLRQIIGLNGRLKTVTYGEPGFESHHPETANRIYAEVLGKNVKQAKARMTELLQSEAPEWQGYVAATEEAEVTDRKVKYYEKGDRPLELIPTRQWFVKLLQHKQDLLDKAAAIKWHPQHMRVRMDNWTEGLLYDWNISRQRYFGVPLPVWYKLDEEGNPDLENPIIPGAEQLPVDPLFDAPEGYTEAQRGQANGFKGETDVFDTWFTSSLTPQIASKWLVDPARHANLFPADVRPQSHEIIRTWAFYTIAKALLHEDKVPWDNVLVSGWILDPDRKKMSKSVGNVVTPEDFLDKFMPDGVRYWSAKAKLGVDTIFDEGVMKIGRRLVTKLYNAGKFVYAQHGFEAPVTHEIDKGFLADLHLLVQRVTKDFEKFDHSSALAETESFFWNNFTDSYLELVKKRAFDATEENAADSGSAITALRIGLGVMLRLFAPFLPYITEELWSWIAAEETGETSVHRAPWPNTAEFSVLEAPSDKESFASAVACLAAIHKHKSENNVSVGTSMTDLTIETSAAVIARLERCLSDIQNAARAATVVLKASEAEIEDGFRITGGFVPKEKKQ